VRGVKELITDRIRLNKIILGVLITLSVSCQNSPSTIKPSQNPNVTKTGNVVSSPVPNNVNPDTTSDEKSINQLIENNPDFFPKDINKEEDASQATVPNNGGVVFATVPNNGGVVFVADPESYSTKALFSSPSAKLRPIAEIVRERVKQRLNRLKAKLPVNWVRKLIGIPERKVTIKLNETKTKAEITITTTFKRQLIFNKDSATNAKNITEKSVITSIFVKEGNAWKISKVSPIELQSAEEKENTEQIKLKLDSIKLVAYSKDNSGKDKTTTFDLDLNNPKEKDNLPTISRGDILTLEVKATNKDETFDPPLYAFVRLPSINFRIPLLDDGSDSDILPSLEGNQISGDNEKDDDIYTGNIVIKQSKGLNYLTIDLIDAASFENGADPTKSSYGSITKSIPFMVK
jgi:hypothetical protein